MAEVTKTKSEQVNNIDNKNRKKKNAKAVKAIEIVSKSKYEKLEHKYKKLERSQEKTVKRVEDLEDVIKCMRWQDTCKNGFIFSYMKLRHRPRLSEDEEKELYSEDGKHWYPLNGLTLEPVGFTHDRFSRRLVKPMPIPSPWGYMGYNKPMDNNRYWELEGLAEKIAGRKCAMNFSHPDEDREFDRICRNMSGGARNTGDSTLIS